jgi:glycosyltransferase involved in cell wall biosynthesis
MKIAIVSQPLDTIMPPYQNSVGACTYGVAQPLSESAEVLIYTLRDKHESVAFLPAERNIDFHFLLNDNALRETMGRAGRRRAFEHFSWLKVAEQMHARYDELLSA